MTKQQVEALKPYILLQFQIRQAINHRQHMYVSLLEQKLKGTLYRFEDITKDTLVQLYVQERVTDKEISELFGIPIIKISLKRREWSISKIFGTNISIPIFGEYLATPKPIRVVLP